MKEDTICAISTPLGAGGIAIIRLSGPSAIKIADELFSAKNSSPSKFSSRELVLGDLKTKNFNEKCMCVVFRKPNSFTGEDVVEFQVHGGVKIAVDVVSECVRLGARNALKGEFSKRAFLNGKSSLDKLEGMIDMINAESEAELKAAELLSSGKLSIETKKFQKELTDSLAEIEVAIDYPEEDLEVDSTEKVKSKMQKLSAKLLALLETSSSGKMIKDGVMTLIVGKPNVGKSSLLNSLLQKERAIVTEIAGTTRDTIEDTFFVDGVKFNLIDTAGIHSSENLIENLGIEKAKKLVKSADIVLFVVDQSAELSKEDLEIFELVKNKNVICVKNKTDKKVLSHDFKVPTVETNAINGEGIEKLKKLMFEKSQLSSVNFSEIVLTNERHVDALSRAKSFLDTAIKEIENNMTLDVVAFNLKEAFDALGEITGTTSNEEIINTIFAKFCVGK